MGKEGVEEEEEERKRESLRATKKNFFHPQLGLFIINRVLLKSTFC
jgi:hypothetical protein